MNSHERVLSMRRAYCLVWLLLIECFGTSQVHTILISLFDNNFIIFRRNSARLQAPIWGWIGTLHNKWTHQRLRSTTEEETRFPWCVEKQSSSKDIKVYEIISTLSLKQHRMNYCNAQLKIYIDNCAIEINKNYYYYLIEGSANTQGDHWGLLGPGWRCSLDSALCQRTFLRVAERLPGWAFYFNFIQPCAENC